MSVYQNLCVYFTRFELEFLSGLRFSSLPKKRFFFGVVGAEFEKYADIYFWRGGRSVRGTFPIIKNVQMAEINSDCVE